jgi:predicted DCC family thiol-disulfide oxidoreductase YuxK
MALTTDYAPSRPLMVYDGDCDFCKYWIAHWQWRTGERVDYAPYQQAAQRFPDLPPENFEKSVCLIEPDGRAFHGAEAVFRAQAKAPGHGLALWLYRRAPGAAPASEGAYRFVARHRGGFMRLTRWLWGSQPERPMQRLLYRISWPATRPAFFTNASTSRFADNPAGGETATAAAP